MVPLPWIYVHVENIRVFLTICLTKHFNIKPAQIGV